MWRSSKINGDGKNGSFPRPSIPTFSECKKEKNSNIPSIQKCNFGASEWSKVWFEASHKKESCHIVYEQTAFKSANIGRCIRLPLKFNQTNLGIYGDTFSLPNNFLLVTYNINLSKVINLFNFLISLLFFVRWLNLNGKQCFLVFASESYFGWQSWSILLLFAHFVHDVLLLHLFITCLVCLFHQHLPLPSLYTLFCVCWILLNVFFIWGGCAENPPSESPKAQNRSLHQFYICYPECEQTERKKTPCNLAPAHLGS